MVRCGLTEYRNNKNYQYAEKWEEFADGTLQKKVVLDNGFGERSLKHFGWKLNLAILEEVSIVRNKEGMFLHFMDHLTDKPVDSLDEVIKSKDNFIQWSFENETLDNISGGEII